MKQYSLTRRRTTTRLYPGTTHVYRALQCVISICTWLPVADSGRSSKNLIHILRFCLVESAISANQLISQYKKIVMTNALTL